MNGLLYFVPNQPAIANSDMRRLGLEPVHGENTPECRLCGGPGGAEGVLFSTPGAFKDSRGTIQMAALRHDSAKQTWRKCMDGAYWLGYWNDRKPGPQDLAREELTGGHIVTLGDGNKWLVPVARLMGGGSAFPRKMTLDENGEYAVGDVVDRYKDVCSRADVIFEAFMAAWERELEKPDARAMPDLTVADALNLSVDILSVNYRVGKYEVAALELLTDQNTGITFAPDNVLGALIDLPSIPLTADDQQDDLSKKNGGSAPTNSGDAG